MKRVLAFLFGLTLAFIFHYLTLPGDPIEYQREHFHPLPAATSTPAATPTPEERYQDPAAVRQLVRQTFPDAPVMIQVARCESTFRHYLSDGSVLQGRVDPADTGVMQINKRYHEAAAERMGLDLEDIHDNLAYARHLYDTQGAQPWYASANCWSKHLSYHR